MSIGESVIASGDIRVFAINDKGLQTSIGHMFPSYNNSCPAKTALRKHASCGCRHIRSDHCKVERVIPDADIFCTGTKALWLEG